MCEMYQVGAVQKVYQNVYIIKYIEKITTVTIISVVIYMKNNLNYVKMYVVCPTKSMQNQYKIVPEFFAKNNVCFKKTTKIHNFRRRSDRDSGQDLAMVQRKKSYEDFSPPRRGVLRGSVMGHRQRRSCK